MTDLFTRLFAALGGGAAVIGSVSATTALAGLIYIIDCRLTAGRDFERANSCYLSGLPMMGLGIGTAGGWRAGYETYNPRLRRRPEDEDAPQPRDDHGRFTRRHDRPRD